MGKKNKLCIIKCVDQECQDCILRETKYVNPTKIDNYEIRKLLAYFLYNAPIKKCLHHSRIPDKENDGEILREMVDNNEKYVFIGGSNVRDKLDCLKLDGEKVCMECQRAICARSKNERTKTWEESEWGCFLRHIRNSIAHGRIVLHQQSNRYYIMFEDKTDKENISARIVCDIDCLLKWKAILEKYSENNNNIL